jgi:hypothetical protein
MNVFKYSVIRRRPDPMNARVVQLLINPPQPGWSAGNRRRGPYRMPHYNWRNGQEPHGVPPMAPLPSAVRYPGLVKCGFVFNPLRISP